MLELDFGIAHAQFLEKKGRYAEAAELFHKEGRTLYAIELLIRDAANKQSVRKALEYVVKALWSHLSFAVQPWTRNADEIQRLFELRAQLGYDAVDSQDSLGLEVYFTQFSLRLY